MTSNNTNHGSGVNISYLVIVTLLTFILPVTGFIVEHLNRLAGLGFALFGKWFIFSAVGLRLFVAGLRQITKPAFTAQEIFHINSPAVFPIVQELGFANLCFGLVGIVSLFLPEWRIVSAFASGLYYGLAALLHIIKKPAGTNEQVALWTDLIIFMVLAYYFFRMI